MTNKVQDAFGTATSNATSTTVTLGTTAISGNILISVWVLTSNNTPTIPTGFTSAFISTGINSTMAVAYKVADGTETAITWTHSSVSTRTSYAYLAEYSGLSGLSPHVLPVNTTSSGVARTSQTTGDTSATTAESCFAMAFGSDDRFVTVGETGSFDNGFSLEHTGQESNEECTLAVYTKSGITPGVVSANFSTTIADQKETGLIVWEEASASVTDINTDEDVTDGEQNATFTTSGFAGEITGVNLVSGSYSLAATGVTSTSGAGDFDVPDISAYATRTASIPFGSIDFSLTDGTDTATLAGTLSVKAGWAVQTITGAVKTTGSVFENFVGTIADGSQVYYPTANNTAIDATGIITTDSTVDIDMQFGEVDTGVWYWDPFTALIEQASSGTVTSDESFITASVRSMVRPAVKPAVR